MNPEATREVERGSVVSGWLSILAAKVAFALILTVIVIAVAESAHKGGWGTTFDQAPETNVFSPGTPRTEFDSDVSKQMEQLAKQMEQLANSLEQYANDHQGLYPKDLRDSQLKAPVGDLKWDWGVAYFGGQSRNSPMTNVLAYNYLVGDSRFMVIMVGGKTDIISNEKWKEMTQRTEGYLEQQKRSAGIARARSFMEEWSRAFEQYADTHNGRYPRYTNDSGLNPPKESLSNYIGGQTRNSPATNILAFDSRYIGYVVLMVGGKVDIVTSEQWQTMFRDTQEYVKQHEFDASGAEAREAMQELSKALESYADAHDGRYPKNLHDSQLKAPSSVTAHSTEYLGSTEYIGGQSRNSPKTNILAYKLMRTADDNRYVVIAVGGNIDILTEDQLKTMLESTQQYVRQQEQADALAHEKEKRADALAHDKDDMEKWSQAFERYADAHKGQYPKDLSDSDLNAPPGMTVSYIGGQYRNWPKTNILAYKVFSAGNDFIVLLVGGKVDSLSNEEWQKRFQQTIQYVNQHRTKPGK